jgi:hypothetical protein
VRERRSRLAPDRSVAYVAIIGGAVALAAASRNAKVKA